MYPRQTSNFLYFLQFDGFEVREVSAEKVFPPSEVFETHIPSLKVRATCQVVEKNWKKKKVMENFLP